jgi:hypothetical protein
MRAGAHFLATGRGKKSPSASRGQVDLRHCAEGERTSPRGVSSTLRRRRRRGRSESARIEFASRRPLTFPELAAAELCTRRRATLRTRPGSRSAYRPRPRRGARNRTASTRDRVASFRRSRCRCGRGQAILSIMVVVCSPSWLSVASPGASFHARRAPRRGVGAGQLCAPRMPSTRATVLS